MKVQKQKLNIIAIKNILQKQFQIEKYILFKYCEYNLFIEYWTVPYFHGFVFFFYHVSSSGGIAPFQITAEKNVLFTDVCVFRRKKRRETSFVKHFFLLSFSSSFFSSLCSLLNVLF